MKILRFAVYGVVCASAFAAEHGVSTQDWSHYVRIAGHSLSRDKIPEVITDSERTHVFGIEVDNDIPGRYESFLDPAKKLDAIRLAAQAAHAAGNKAFVYIAGLECITANAAKSQHTFFKDHPDWVQRDRNGKPAVFGNGTAFWITAGDEDVWVSPYAPEWRKRYMSLVRQIAGTGIDGVYVDIPYWMTHFTGWENTWASFDRYTVAAFRAKTGIDALHDIRLGDASDPHFRRWVDFRIESITTFMQEINGNVKKVNPQCLTIAEIFPGIESAVPRVGADVYQLYPVVDAIAHEYQGPSDKMAASRTAFDWLDEMVGMSTFRSFAGSKPTWMLNYSWDGETGVSIPDAMKMLFASQLTAGANTWDARGHVMSGSNDIEVRREVFGWIAQHEHTFYDRREPISPVGVYFSPKTRDYFPDDFVPEFKAAVDLLLLSHREFQVVTPRTLDSFRGHMLLVPASARIDGDELARIRNLKTRGIDSVQFAGQLSHFGRTLGEQFPSAAEAGAPATGIQEQITALTERLPAGGEVVIHSSPFVISQIARVDGKAHVFLLNLKGLAAKRKLLPDAESETSIDFVAGRGARVFALPFLGAVSELPFERSAGKIHVRVPSFERSVVVWCEEPGQQKSGVRE